LSISAQFPWPPQLSRIEDEDATSPQSARLALLKAPLAILRLDTAGDGERAPVGTVDPSLRSAFHPLPLDRYVGGFRGPVVGPRRPGAPSGWSSMRGLRRPPGPPPRSPTTTSTRPAARWTTLPAHPRGTLLLIPLHDRPFPLTCFAEFQHSRFHRHNTAHTSFPRRLFPPHLTIPPGSFLKSVAPLVGIFF